MLVSKSGWGFPMIWASFDWRKFPFPSTMKLPLSSRATLVSEHYSIRFSCNGVITLICKSIDQYFGQTHSQFIDRTLIFGEYPVDGPAKVGGSDRSQDRVPISRP